MAEPTTSNGLFLRDGLVALGFDEDSANERIVAIEDEARNPQPWCYECAMYAGVHESPPPHDHPDNQRVLGEPE